MMIIEILLLLSMLGLLTVLLLEMREYKKVRNLAIQLDALVTTYAGGFNAVTNAINSLESRYSRTAEEHIELQNELILIRGIIDVHNAALNLNTNLVGIKSPKLE